MRAEPGRASSSGATPGITASRTGTSRCACSSSSRRRPPRARPARTRERVRTSRAGTPSTASSAPSAARVRSPEPSAFSAEPTPSGSSIAASSSACSSAPSTSRSGRLTVAAGQASLEESHDGEELVYATRGALRVEAGGVEATPHPAMRSSSRPGRPIATRRAPSPRRCSAWRRATPLGLRRHAAVARRLRRATGSLSEVVARRAGAVGRCRVATGRRGRGSRPATERLRPRSSPARTSTAAVAGRARRQVRRPDDPPDASADAAQTAATTNTSPRSASAARGSNLDAVVLSMWFTSSRVVGQGSRPNQSADRPEARRRRTAPAPAKATVTSCFSSSQATWEPTAS